MSLAALLALRELRHDWLAALCFVAALVGVLAPFLIILALKNGAIDSMLSRLVEDPSNREIFAVGADDYSMEFFDEMRERDDVEFIVARTRNINAQANMVRNRSDRRVVRKVSLIPSAAGDPISTTADVSPGHVVLSSRLAEALEAKQGTVLEMRIDRRSEGQTEGAVRELVVAGTVPPENYGRPAMFISVEDMLAIERFRDDLSISAESWADPTDLPDSFPSFRMYAKTLRDIPVLEREMKRRDKAVRLRAENVDFLLSFRRNLNLLFAFIAGLAIAGIWSAMAANLRGSVERQRSSLSLLNLLGMDDNKRRLIPITQSLVLVMSGVVITLLLVLPILTVINSFFTPEGFERIAWLGIDHVFWTCIIGLVTAITASAWAAIAIKDIGADEILHST